MGQPKHTLILNGETLLLRQLRLLRSVCRAVAVLGASDAPTYAQALTPEAPLRMTGEEFEMVFGVPVYPDEWLGRGPLAGIYTALLHTRTEYNLIIGCDMPYLSASFLRYLCLRAEASQADVTVPQSRDRRLQPLCAVYRRRARSAVRSSLAQGQNKVSRFYPRVRCEIVGFQEMAQAGFQDYLFSNMNTPSDFEALRRNYPGRIVGETKKSNS